MCCSCCVAGRVVGCCAVRRRRPRRRAARRQAVPRRRGHAQRHDGHGVQPVDVRRRSRPCRRRWAARRPWSSSTPRTCSRCPMRRPPSATMPARALTSSSRHGSQYGASVQEIAKDFPKVDLCLGHRCQHLRPAQRVRLHGGGGRRRLCQRRAGGQADQEQDDRRDRPGGSGRCQDLHRRLRPGCGVGRPDHQGRQDLDRLLLRRGADDRSGQDAHRRRRGRADRLVAVGGRLDRRGQGKGQRAVVRHAGRPGLAGARTWSSPARCTTGPASSRR